MQSPGSSSRLVRDLAQPGRNSDDEAAQSVSREEGEEGEKESAKIGSLKADELRRKPSSFSFSISPSAQASKPDVSVLKVSSPKNDGDAIGSTGEKNGVIKGMLESEKIKSSFNDSGESKSAAKTRVEKKNIKLDMRREGMAESEQRGLDFGSSDSTRNIPHVMRRYRNPRSEADPSLVD